MRLWSCELVRCSGVCKQTVCVGGAVGLFCGKWRKDGGWGNKEAITWGARGGDYRRRRSGNMLVVQGRQSPRYGELDQIAWYNKNSGETTHAVGQKQANAWGLHDTLGNVWEWCYDWFGGYSAQAATDLVGAATGTYRVLRGGSWNNNATTCGRRSVALHADEHRSQRPSVSVSSGRAPSCGDCLNRP
jgi:formylglycine-generating enzyme required for sulfatase activity